MRKVTYECMIRGVDAQISPDACIHVFLMSRTSLWTSNNTPCTALLPRTSDGGGGRLPVLVAVLEGLGWCLLVLGAPALSALSVLLLLKVCLCRGGSD